MEINPYLAEVIRLESDRDSLIRREKSLGVDIEWLGNFDVTLASADAEELETALKTIDRNTMAAEQQGAKIEADVARLRAEGELMLRSHVADVTAMVAQLPSAFNPLYWFKSDHQAVELAEAAKRRLKVAVDRLAGLIHNAEENLNRHNAHVARLLGERTRMSEDRSHVSGLIGRYQAMNLSHLHKVRDEAIAQLESVEGRLLVARGKRDRVEAGLQVIRPKLRDLEIQRERLEKQLASAVRFKRELEMAANGGLRRPIHAACLAELGESNPGPVIRKVERSLHAIDRDVAKLRSRADHIASVAARVVNRVVFDGSNLCFKNAEFIGLGAIIAAANALAKRSYVIVIFDRSITKRLGSSVASIRSMFDGVQEVHVVQNKRVADETVLEAATADDVLVVSNDRFAEFIDKKARRENRIATHEIVGGRVMIPDLEVSEVYA